MCVHRSYARIRVVHYIVPGIIHTYLKEKYFYLWLRKENTRIISYDYVQVVFGNRWTSDYNVHDNPFLFANGGMATAMGERGVPSLTPGSEISFHQAPDPKKHSTS